jgi:hypothetical protein
MNMKSFVRLLLALSCDVGNVIFTVRLKGDLVKIAE